MPSLEETLDLMRDEFTRIEVVMRDYRVEMDEQQRQEILGLCERAKSDITQRVPLIQQRDAAQAQADALREERDQLQSTTLAGQRVAELEQQTSKLADAFVDVEDRRIALEKENEALRHEVAFSAELETRVAELETALRTARETIQIWHGEIAWPEYQHSPEMKQINAALAAAPSSTEPRPDAPAQVSAPDEPAQAQ